MKTEAKENADKGVDTSIPEGFGLPQKDAGTFKPITIKSRKRKIEEVANNEDQKQTNEAAQNGNSKKLKVDESQNQIVSDNKN
jgi:hypothetical protein